MTTRRKQETPRNDTAQHDRWITSDEAALRTGFSAGHLARLRVTGDGPPYAKRGGAKQAHVRYLVSALDKWMAEGMRTSTSDTAKAG